MSNHPFAGSRRRNAALACLITLACLTHGWGELSLWSNEPAPVRTAKPSAAKAKAAWTLLLYGDADNDLEGAALGNLEELLEIGSSSDVHVIALIDRSTRGGADEAENAVESEASESDDDADASEDPSGYTDRAVANLEDWTGAKLLYVEEDHLRELEDWGPTNMGDPRTLTRFLRTAARACPAERYALVLNDHGQGWSGICWDDSAEDELTTAEVCQALQQAHSATGRLDLLGCDACLMANVEFLYEAAPHAKILVASEELVPGTGWNYVPIVRALRRRPGCTAAELGEVVADSFRDYFSKANRQEGSGVTLSVIDSEKLKAIAPAARELTRELLSTNSAGPADHWDRVARARVRAAEFGKSGGPDDGSRLFDLVHLCNHLGTELGNSKVQPAAARLAAAARAAVLHNVHGKDRGNAHGLTIYFPRRASELAKVREAYAQLGFVRDSDWYSLVAHFAAIPSRRMTKAVLGELRGHGRQAGGGRTVTVTADVRSDQMQAAWFVVAPETTPNAGSAKPLAGTAPGTGLLMASTADQEDSALSADWDGHVHVLSQGAQRLTCPVVDLSEATADDESDDSPEKTEAKSEADPDSETDATAEEEPTAVAEVPVQVRRGASKKWLNVVLQFGYAPDNPSEAVTLSSAWLESRNGQTEFELHRGDEVRPRRWDPRESTLKLVPVTEGGSTIIVEDADELTLSRQALPAGQYRIGFVVTDLEGHVERELLDPITIVPNAASTR